jgi:hypothetical protein
MSEKITPLRQALGAARGRSSNRATYLPEGCPVTPLGGDGTVFWYLNAIQQLVRLPAQQHSKNLISALFAPHVTTWCYQHYPKSLDQETGAPRDYKVDQLVQALMAEAQARGQSWEPADNIHGRGIWPGEDGALRVHLGRTLLVGGKPRAPGIIGQRVYPLCPEWQGPAPDAQSGGPAGPAAELLALLECWHWASPRLAPRLLLGWVMAALLCGALDWRPHVWLTAPRGSGKSTLFDLLGFLLQRGQYLLAAENASAPSLRAKLQFDARPVMLDETEPSEDNRALNATVELLRLASSGGTVMRATIDQNVVEQTVRFVAICASVVRPALKAQDASRIAVLQLLPPPAGTAAPLLRPQLLELLGRRLLRRALDGWARWPDTLDAWRKALAAQGMKARAQDQYGTLLALAWIAEQDDAPDSDSLDEWAQLAAEMTQPDRAEERPEWFRLIETLAATTLRDEAGRHDASVAELLETASFARRTPDPDSGGWLHVSAKDAKAANATLARHGLFFEPIEDAHGRPLRHHWHDAGRAPCGQGDGAMVGHVAIANSHPILAKLLDRTQWAARAGAPGAWKAVLEAAPGAVLAGASRFGPRTSRSVKVPIALFFDGVSGHE